MLFSSTGIFVGRVVQTQIAVFPFIMISLKQSNRPSFLSGIPFIDSSLRSRMTKWYSVAKDLRLAILNLMTFPMATVP